MNKKILLGAGLFVGIIGVLTLSLSRINIKPLSLDTVAVEAAQDRPGPKEPQVVDCNKVENMVCRECGYLPEGISCCNSSYCQVICDDILPNLDPKTNTCGK